jgi:hypothetical protein
MAENLTTYTEVDPNSHLSATSARATAANVTSGEDAYFYKDFGADYFDKISLMFKLYIGSTTDEDGGVSVGFANNVDDSANWTTKLRIGMGRSSGIFVALHTATDSDTSISLSSNTPYYCTLERLAGSNTATLYIYSDSARASLVDTLTVTGVGTSKFRYFYPLASYNFGESGPDFDGYTENFEFIAAAVGRGQIIGLEAW